MHAQAGNQRQEGRAHGGLAQGFEVTGHMMADEQIEFLKVSPELALLVQPPQKTRQLDGMIGNESNIGILHEIQVIATQHISGGGFRANDVVTFAGKVAEYAEVFLSRVAGGIDVAVGQGRHAAALLVGRDVNVETIVLQHSHYRFGDLRVVVVGVDVYKVGDLGPAAVGLIGQAAAAGTAKKAAPGKRRQAAFLGDAEELFQNPAEYPVAQGSVYQDRESTAELG